MTREYRPKDQLRGERYPSQYAPTRRRRDMAVGTRFYTVHAKTRVRTELSVLDDDRETTLDGDVTHLGYWAPLDFFEVLS